MKKISISIFIILICYLGFGQTYPIQQNLGSGTTLVKTPNYGGFQSGLIPYTFADTSAANTALTYGKNYNGFEIYTQTPQAKWWRLADSSKWIMILPQGGGTPQSGQAWINPGNFNLFTDSKLNGGFGTLARNGIYIKTNGVSRLYLDKDGIAPETGTSVGIGIDPSDSNRVTFFSGGGGGSGWQLTGNAGTTPPTSFIGTTDSVDFVVKTKALERLRVNANGALGVGTGADYGTSGYVLQSNGNGTSPTWVIHNNNFDATVDFSVNINPNTGGTTFNPNTPQLTTKIYVSTIDGSQWTWNGAVYVIYVNFGWGILGNAGTTVGINFIGTTDNKGLMFKTNNIQSGYIDLVNSNTSLGVQTLVSNTSGTDNSVFGYQSLIDNTSGSFNTAMGKQAISSNSSGISNSAFGHSALLTNQTGDANIGIGYNAGRYTGIGNSNRLFINSINRSDEEGDTTRSIIYGAQDATAANQRLYLNSKIYAPYIPSGVGDKSVRWNSSTKEFTYADTTSGGGSSTITNGTTAMSGFTNTYIPYNNAGTIGQYAISGTGNVAMSASPTFTGTVNGADANFTGLFSVGANPLGTDIAASKSGLNIYYNTTSTTSPVSLLLGTTAAFSKSLRFQAYPASYSTSGMEIADNGALFSVGMPFNVGTYSNHASDFWTNNTRRGGISGSGAVDFTGAMRLSNYGAGTATFDASGNITSVSDERLKTAIKPYTSGLKQLLLLKPIQYKWNEKSGNETKETYAGFSAQNVKSAIPYGTGENKDGYLSLQERAIVATLVNAVKEQQQQIEELKREIIKLQNK